MAQKQNNVAIGLFVVGAALIMMLLSLFISTGGFGRDTTRVVMVFDGSVKGLKVGAPVAFKGVEIGKVTAVNLLMDTDSFDVFMPVEMDIRENAFRKIGSNQDESSLPELIDRGMRGQLQLQSLLTGLLYIQLDFHPDSEVKYTNIDSDLTQLPTIATDMEKLSRSLQDMDIPSVIEDIRATIVALSEIVSDPELKNIAGNLNNTLDAVETLSTQLQQEVEKSSPGINSFIATADATMQELGKELPGLSSRLASTLESMDNALSSFDTAMESMRYNLSDEAPAMYELRQAAREVTRASRAMRGLAETLDEQPEALIKGKSRVEQ